MVLLAEDCSSTPWNRPWEPVRSYHTSRLRRWGPWARSADLAGRQAWPGLQPPPKLDIWAVLVSLVLSPWGMACPKLVCLGAWACFGPIEPDSCSLIGCAFCLDLLSVFPCS